MAGQLVGAPEGGQLEDHPAHGVADHDRPMHVPFDQHLEQIVGQPFELVAARAGDRLSVAALVDRR